MRYGRLKIYNLLVFISEITARAFIIADSNKRRTLSRSDIAKALSKSDQFDFLIDIVPREELPFPTTSTTSNGAGKKGSTSTQPDQVSVVHFINVSKTPFTSHR